MTRRLTGRTTANAAMLLGVTGCATLPPAPPHPNVAPATQPAVSLDLAGRPVGPMYRTLLAVDLPTVVRVAGARSLDVQEARERVRANRGRYEAAVEAVFPVIAPSIAVAQFRGEGQNANGTLTAPTHFDNLLPALSVQWVLNPGQVVYDIVAAKRRLEAADQQARAASLDVLHRAAGQFYALVLAQARLEVAKQSVDEAKELLRVTQLQVSAGTGLPADQLRAETQVAAFEQDVVVALNDFYQASVALTLTLDLDPLVTLVPAGRRVDQTTLVRDDLDVDHLLDLAAGHRPDLAAARSLVLASQADTGSTVWGGVGPQVQANYTATAWKTSGLGQGYGWKEQLKDGASAGVALGPSLFGRLKTAEANQQAAAIDARRQLDAVAASVVSAQQTSQANAKLIPVAKRQLDSAQEALRLTQANLKAGTALVIDVLQAEDAAANARLRYITAVVHYNQSQLDLATSLGFLDLPTASEPTPPPTTAPTPTTAGEGI